MPSLLLALAVGCAPGPLGAPEGSTISVPADQGLIFDVAYSTPDDAVGLLVREHADVFGPDGRALNGVLVEITSGWNGTYVIPSKAVQLVDEFEAGCDGDKSEECQAWFDTGTERYVEFSDEFQDLDGFRPTYMSTESDNRGMVDFYVFVDSIPSDDDGEVIPIPMYASIGVDTASWSYDFQ
jgi:hypothetical protein